MPAKFDKLGISFLYPENWTLDEADVAAGRMSVTVYSPGGAFWSVTLHSQTADPARLAAAAIDAMREEYTDLEAEKIEETVAGHDLTGYDLNFFYLDLTNTAGIRILHLDAMTYTIFFQAEDREYDKIHRVFDAMTTSLLEGLGSTAA